MSLSPLCVSLLAFKWTHSGFGEDEANDALHLCSSKNFVFWGYNKTQDSCNLLALVVAHSTQPLAGKPIWITKYITRTVVNKCVSYFGTKMLQLFFGATMTRDTTSASDSGVERKRKSLWMLNGAQCQTRRLGQHVC